MCHAMTQAHRQRCPFCVLLIACLTPPCMQILGPTVKKLQDKYKANPQEANVEIARLYKVRRDPRCG